MIEFAKISKKYATAPSHALDNVSFKIEEGEFVFVIGPSGSGKTTAMRLLIREELPSEGKIFFDEYDITKLSRRKVYRLRRLIGVVFQDYKLIEHKNTYENIAFAMEVAGASGKDIKKRVPELLEIVGLADKARSFPNQLSGGEQQRVAIARAISNDPRVLIADEPTGNLDPASAWDIVQILNKINEWGTTVLMSTHGTDIVNSLNKRVIQLEGGEVVRDDSKGRYELTRSDFSDQMLAAQGEKPQPENKKQTIKVDLKTDKISERLKQRRAGEADIDDADKEVGSEQESEVKEKKSRRPFLNLFGRKREERKEVEENKGKKKTKKEQSTAEIEQQAPKDSKKKGVGLAGDRNVIRAEINKKILEKEIEAIDTQGGESISKGSDRIAIDKLDIDVSLVELLQENGYTKIADIIAAGPDKLLENSSFSPLDVIEISQALGEFVEVEMEAKSKRKRGGKKKQTKRKSKASRGKKSK